jgi:hypothetical protein
VLPNRESVLAARKLAQYVGGSLVLRRINNVLLQSKEEQPIKILNMLAALFVILRVLFLMTAPAQ